MFSPDCSYREYVKTKTMVSWLIKSTLLIRYAFKLNSPFCRLCTQFVLFSFFPLEWKDGAIMISLNCHYLPEVNSQFVKRMCCVEQNLMSPPPQPSTTVDSPTCFVCRSLFLLFRLRLRVLLVGSFLSQYFSFLGFLPLCDFLFYRLSIVYWNLFVVVL